MAINQINRTPSAMCAGPPGIRKMCGPFPLISIPPYPDTRELSLSREEKASCCRVIEEMMEEGVPVFNLKSAFPYLIDGSFPTPCRQCVVMENGTLSTCGRCISVPDLSASAAISLWQNTP